MNVDLTLVSHTNVGKTSLMRTLLRRDIGEVADRAHVTEAAESHELVQSAAGDSLLLWDTPGFGDSARLLKRLQASGNPIGWLVTQVWDRLTDRPFFCSQQAIRAVRDSTDVVLYLVNAAEDPSGAGYVDAELRILAWIGKPVLVLLNQTGPTRGRAADLADETAWSRALAAHVEAHRVMALDAFARCWVQEDRLLGAVEALLPAEKRPPFVALRAAWRARNREVFDQSMRVLSEHLAEVAGHGEAVPERSVREMLTSFVDRKEGPDAETDRAMKALAARYDESVRASTDRLISLHGLAGRSREQILARVAGQFEVSKPADVKKSSLVGGVVSGALGGLAADLAAGGLTFGAAALAGAILGALGAGGAAQAYNAMQGVEEGRVRWSTAFLAERPAAALLRYLAVAHFGRGRGEWSEGEHPAHWRPLVARLIEERRARFDAAWPAGPTALQPVLAECAREALATLYPESRELLAMPAPAQA